MWPLVLAMPREPSGLRRSRCFARIALVLHVVQVGVDDRDAVELDRDPPPLDGDLLGVPFTHRLLVPALRRDHVVDGAVILRGPQVPILGTAVVEHLDLDPGVGRVPLEGGANADSVVGVLGELDLELQDEVFVLLLGVEVATVFRRREEHAVLDLVALARTVLGPPPRGGRTPSRSGPCR